MRGHDRRSNFGQMIYDVSSFSVWSEGEDTKKDAKEGGRRLGRERSGVYITSLPTTSVILNFKGFQFSFPL